ncbi:uncharacterized protein A4U43_C07F26770 [Asparagus officinalis]|uniref:Uncharacterized protein n=1 Tax=Asparagus officinalis TaxID=4686 RepID=A0A5P1EF32_ASPOF|nr:uncharacterized protein A4U43_C07F26770 [Asparagus officinalis]
MKNEMYTTTIKKIADHKRDAARAEDALALSYRNELIGMQRDWNEELQSCREFPHTTLQERYVHNNIFFSFAVDADLGLLSKGQTSTDLKVTVLQGRIGEEGGEEAKAEGAVPKGDEGGVELTERNIAKEDPLDGR